MKREKARGRHRMNGMGTATTIMATLIVVVSGWSCGQGPTDSPDIPGDTATDTNDDSDAGNITKPDPVVVDENFRVIYSYSPVTGKDAPEILVADPRLGSGETGFPSWSDNYRLVEQSLSKADLDCSLGCMPSRDLRHMAVMTASTDGTLGQTMVLIRFDERMNATIVSDHIAGVRQATFAGSRLILSIFRQDCDTNQGTQKTCYRFYSIDLENTAQPEFLFEFPSTQLLADSLFSGRFRIGADDVSIIVQNLEKESRTFWVFDETGLRQVGEKVCQVFDTRGECAYSENAPAMTDDDPVLLTPDRGSLVFPHVRDNKELGLGRIDTATGGFEWTGLLWTTKDYPVNACYNMRGDWRYTRIMQPLLFLADRGEVVFTAASECALDIGKSWTDILAVKVDDIGSVDQATDGFFRKITSFPQEGSPDCISISADTLSVSPSGRFISFVGTAIRDSSGTPLTSAMPQHLIDREAFVTAIDGQSWPIQISGDLDYRASATLCSPDNPWFLAVTDPVEE